ncbi:hypothetical protein, conserved [Eimeria maxima]|uniref:Rhoptry neck protein RON1 n=1 Tax=Eimeria maxima TaxID=5804 RepID=U6MBF6_EIMMA|nr:hypothetical protein, conserved [Eimeria maxima]CDJ59000.1 hypothetical protein, conserved [Eimeria maxima]
MVRIWAILVAYVSLVFGGRNVVAALSERAPYQFGSGVALTTSSVTQEANPHLSEVSRFKRRQRLLHGVLQQDSTVLRGAVGASEPIPGIFLQLQSDLEHSQSTASQELGGSSASAGDSHLEKHKESSQEASNASKREAKAQPEEDFKASATNAEGSQASEGEHSSHSKGHGRSDSETSETATHKEEEEAGKTLHESASAEGGAADHKKTKAHQPGHQGEEAKEHERENLLEPGRTAGGVSEQGKTKPHELDHTASDSLHEEAEEKTHKHVHGPAKFEEEVDFNSLINRLRPLLSAAKGKELYGRLVTIVDLHEKAVAVEEELKAEARKETAQEEALKEKTGSDVATQEDLLLTQQLSNMWVLPFYEETKRETCLSGFEGLAHEATITCADPECFKLETQAQQCHYMSIESIMRKEEFETESGQPKWQKSPHPQAAKDHMILGFDGECRKPEALGSEILNMLQHPRQLAKKHALERATGSGGTAPPQKHHLDLKCETEENADNSSCKTVYEALQHVAESKPRALPELLVLTDIKDLKNTLGLYRIALIFEGLVQFTTPEGNKVDAFQHKLRAEDAEFVRKHRHQDISSTVMLKEE